jgi:hypothetical protein
MSGVTAAIVEAAVAVVGAPPAPGGAAVKDVVVPAAIKAPLNSSFFVSIA